MLYIYTAGRTFFSIIASAVRIIPEQISGLCRSCKFYKHNSKTFQAFYALYLNTTLLQIR